MADYAESTKISSVKFYTYRHAEKRGGVLLTFKFGREIVIDDDLASRGLLGSEVLATINTCCASRMHQNEITLDVKAETTKFCRLPDSWRKVLPAVRQNGPLARTPGCHSAH